MTRTLLDEPGLSTDWSIDGMDAGLRTISDGSVGVASLSSRLRLSNVRDYKDRFILSMMQDQARGENPGFLPLKRDEKAKMAWLADSGRHTPVGYYIYWDARRSFSRYAHGYVQMPSTFSQVYVVPGVRRRGIATRMLHDFISRGSSGALWVESPKPETVALLHKLGYHESNERYELWQMMEGLTRWVLADEVVWNGTGMSRECPEAWVWAGDSSVGMDYLR